MANEKEAGQSLIHVKAGTTGVDVSVSEKVPALLSRLLPLNYRLRKGVDHAIADRIVAKIAEGDGLNDAELAFAEGALSDQAQKYVRLGYIQDRAQQLFEANTEPPLLPVSVSAANNHEIKSTSNDWVNKFREDASLVDDEVLREIYARVLFAEERSPCAFALRTLGVLRYMDREVAAAFGRLQKVLVNGCAVPMQSNRDSHVLQVLGLEHTTMLMLGDAGLVNSATTSIHTMLPAPAIYFTCSGHGRVLMARRKDLSPISAELDVHALTPAGMQLARIAECEADEGAFSALVSWIRGEIGDADLYVADLPSRNWIGDISQLRWRPIDSVAAQQVVAVEE